MYALTQFQATLQFYGCHVTHTNNVSHTYNNVFHNSTTFVVGASSYMYLHRPVAYQQANHL